MSALCVVSRKRFVSLIEGGLRWLTMHQNRDGGWGDTTSSPSNLSTTLLVISAFTLAGGVHHDVLKRAEAFLTEVAGDAWPERVAALRAFYGSDRTFSTPILMNAALAGLVEWKDVPGLPFELARLPRSWLRLLRLQVVSYALPALIAIGQLLHARRPTWCPVKRWFRNRCIHPTLELLKTVQPQSGGFIEAIPLTSFVVMSLAANGRAEHPVARRAVAFLKRGVRDDGSWPIDTNLATWVTTQAVAAMTADGSRLNLSPVREWLLRQQHWGPHPFTAADPGGWAWTDLSGGVPDADDTSGALLALARLEGEMPREAVSAGVHWLLDLQNRDGGWPTFCRGWGRLPFDRSAPDLTAHALRAIRFCEGALSSIQTGGVFQKGFAFLRASQALDGSWRPLWFGNQFAADHANPVYGTSRVLPAYAECDALDAPEVRRAVRFLHDAQHSDGSWGGTPGAPPSVEETALAVHGLAAVVRDVQKDESLVRGVSWLLQRLKEGTLADPSPIGLYFASLWYAEKLYPLIWTVGALGGVLAKLTPGGLPA